MQIRPCTDASAAEQSNRDKKLSAASYIVLSNGINWNHSLFCRQERHSRERLVHAVENRVKRVVIMELDSSWHVEDLDALHALLNNQSKLIRCGVNIRAITKPKVGCYRARLW